MQKLIAKYGLAAHLAILAVAPLFLFPFVGTAAVSTVLLWLSLLAVVWTIQAPSLLGDEHLKDARSRVKASVSRDPLAWVLLVLIVIGGVRAINTGVAMSYDVETTTWSLASARFPILPAAVEDAGCFPFVAILAASIVLMGCRHALGRSARLAFLVVSSALAGVAAVVSHFAVSAGLSGAGAFVAFPEGAFSFPGYVYGVYFLAGVISLFVVQENNWNAVVLLPIFAIGGNGAACFSFAPAYVTLVFVALALVVLVYSTFYSRRSLQLLVKLKVFLVGVAAICLGAFLVVALLPEQALAARLSPYLALSVFPDSFWDVRRALSAVALKSWLTHLWTGTGLGSFAFDFRFNALEADWAMMPRGAVSVSNGWWLLLAERGIVGFVLLLLPVGFLAASYVGRLVGCVRDRALPHPACLLAPLLLALTAAVGFVDCSPMRPEALVVGGAILSISALSFPKKKVDKHG